MPYEAMAPVYDALMDPEERRQRSLRTLAFLRAANIRPGEPVLDLACGTGALSVPLAKAGYRVVASDLCEEMLTVARSRYRGSGIVWVCQDLRFFTAPHPVGAISCGCDGLNYVTEPEELNRFFLRAHQALRPGGVLVFDLATPHKLDSMNGQFYGLDQDDLAYLWSNRAEAGVTVMELTFFLRQPNGLFLRKEERHRQRGHGHEALCRGLQEAGFADVESFSGLTEAPGRPEDLRWQFVARK